MLIRDRDGVYGPKVIDTLDFMDIEQIVTAPRSPWQKGVPQDYVLAHLWFSLAAAQSNDPELKADAIENRDLAESKLTPAEVNEAQRLAREWKPK